MRMILYGDPYYVRTIARCLDYTHPDCTQIFFADHRIADKISYPSRYRTDCLTDSVLNDDSIDELLIITSENSHALLPNSIQNSKINRKMIQMDKISQHRYPSKIFNESILKNRPAILSLSIGQGTQQYFTELLIHYHLKKRKIKFQQRFSPTTEYLLSNKGVHSPLTQENTFSEDYDIFVGGVSVDHSRDLLNWNLPACKAIKQMLPDSAMISCCNSPSLIENDIKTAIAILHYQYRIKKIMIMISEYYCNSNITFPMRTEYRSDRILPDTRYLSDVDFYRNEEIVDRLLSSVYLPDGMIPLR